MKLKLNVLLIVFFCNFLMAQKIDYAAVVVTENLKENSNIDEIRNTVWNELKVIPAFYSDGTML